MQTTSEWGDDQQGNSNVTTSYVSRTRRFFKSAGVNLNSIAIKAQSHKSATVKQKKSSLNTKPHADKPSNPESFHGRNSRKRWPSSSSICDSRTERHFSAQSCEQYVSNYVWTGCNIPRYAMDWCQWNQGPSGNHNGLERGSKRDLLNNRFFRSYPSPGYSVFKIKDGRRWHGNHSHVGKIPLWKCGKWEGRQNLHWQTKKNQSAHGKHSKKQLRHWNHTAKECGKKGGTKHQRGAVSTETTPRTSMKMRTVDPTASPSLQNLLCTSEAKNNAVITFLKTPASSTDYV